MSTNGTGTASRGPPRGPKSAGSPAEPRWPSAQKRNTPLKRPQIANLKKKKEDVPVKKTLGKRETFAISVPKRSTKELKLKGEAKLFFVQGS